MVTLMIWLFITFFMGFLMELLSYLLTSVKKDKMSASTFECGFDAFDSSRDSYSVSFYVVGMLFMVMDVEALFLYPWVSSWWIQGVMGVSGLIDFLLELLLCLMVVWKLNW